MASQDNNIVSHLLDQNPLALGLIALALGALVGALIPETRQENEWMGDTRDKLLGQAQETVQGLAQKVGVVAATAETAAHDALDTAQGAAHDSLAEALDKVKEAAAEALGSVKEEAQHQGLMPQA